MMIVIIIITTVIIVIIINFIISNINTFITTHASSTFIIFAIDSLIFVLLSLFSSSGLL